MDNTIAYTVLQLEKDIGNDSSENLTLFSCFLEKKSVSCYVVDLQQKKTTYKPYTTTERDLFRVRFTRSNFWEIRLNWSYITWDENTTQFIAGFTHEQGSTRLKLKQKIWKDSPAKT